MISNQEEDEFVAVRVQDPRLQNEGSWNSYVDYKIFLHTNSKAFTAKTSCVRRRYSEFAWLKKKLQKNAGLVPVPELPGKYFFFFSNEDFLERRRRGLQAFLDNVVNMTVCLSDSQLHLFLQTQLPVGHILDCVQGHTPYSVTDAILTYASSNRGYAQAQEEDSIKEPSLTVSYESMESPTPHQPKDVFSPERLSRDDSDPPDGLPEICDEDAVELQSEENSSVRVVQKNDHLKAIVEDCGPAEATFFLGDGQDALEGLGLAEPTQQRSCPTMIQTPVEVHSPMGAGLFEEECSVREEGVTEEKTGPHPEEKEDDDQSETSGEAKTKNVDSEPEDCANSAAVSDFKDRDFEERATESDARPQEEVLDAVCSEQKVLESHLEPVEEDAGCPEEFKNPDGQSESKAETPLQCEIQEEARDELGVPELEGNGGDLVQQMDRGDVDSDGDGRSSSNESIVKISDDESICDDAEDSIHESIHESRDSIQDSIHELNQDSIHESNQDSIHELNQDSIHESNQDSINELNQDSIQDSIHELNQDLINESNQDSIHESIQDSIHELNQDSIHESNQDSINELNQDSIHELNQDSIHESIQDSIHELNQDSTHESIQDSINESNQDSIQDSIHELNQDSIHESRDSIQDSIQDSFQDSIQDSFQDSIQSASGDEKEVGRWSPVEASSRNILDLHTNGRSVEKEEDEDLHNTTGASDSGESLEVNSTVTGEDLTESSDFSIIESGCSAAGKCEETQQVQAH